MAERFRIQQLIDALALAAHCALAASTLLQFVALMSSGRSEGLIAGALFAAMLLPLLPAIRRVLTEKTLAAAIKPRSTGARATLATAVGASALVLLFLAVVGLIGDPQYLSGEPRIRQWILGCLFLWIASVLREFPGASK